MVRLRSPAPKIRSESYGFIMGAFPSGQRGQTVNLLSVTSVVRIHPLPPTKRELLVDKSSLFVYPSRRLGISSPREARCISSRAVCALVSHHAPACISLQLDDIPQQVADDIHALRRDWDASRCKALELPCKILYNTIEGSDCMAKNYLLIYSEQLATDIELLCQNIKAPSNTLFQIRKSSSSVYANIQEANYGQSKADMLSKFEISLKECSYQYCKRRKSISSSGILRYWKRAVTSLMAEKQILR